MRAALLLATVAACRMADVSAAENWPQFRGPRGEGISQARGLPMLWSESEHVAWKTPIHGKGWSSPVVWGNQIWLTTAPEDGRELYALGIDAASGRILHDVKVFDVAEPQYCIPLNSYASSTPVIEQDRVYVHFGSPGTAALDTRTGEVLWARDDLPCNHYRGAASSPILWGDLLIVALDGYDHQYVVALDKHSGQTVWRRDRGIEYGTDNGDMKKAYSTARVIDVDGRPQLVSPSAGATIAYEPATGDEIWRINHGGMNAANPPLWGHGMLFLNSAAGGFKLFAMRTGGTGDVTGSNVVWKCTQGVPTRSAPLLVDDLLFMVSDAGVATCIEARTAKEVWQKRLRGEFSASPILADGRIYFCNQDDRTFVVAPTRDYKLLATNRLDDGCMGSPAVCEQALIVRTKTHLYRLQD